MPTRERRNKEKENIRIKEKIHDIKYHLSHYSEYDYSELTIIPSYKQPGKEPHTTSTAIIMFDTETTKLHPNTHYKSKKGQKVVPVTNAVVAFTVSVRCQSHNICTLYGNRPTELVSCMQHIRNNIKADKILIYAHNLSYDYTFMRQYLFHEFGLPVKQLATKPHYPVSVEFENGIILRDSLCIAQRSLDRWARDMGVEHQKAVGMWDYNIIRKQDHTFTPGELEYIEHDTLAGVECLDKLRESLGVETLEKYYTATGIPRKDVKRIGQSFFANYRFRKMVPVFETYQKLVCGFHGGFTHANRNIIDILMHYVKPKDETSAYPFQMLANKFPMSPFAHAIDSEVNEILDLKNDYAFIFRFSVDNIRLKDKYYPMPFLQKSKALVLGSYYSEDNGRLLCADHYEAYLTEVDLEVINKYYEWDSAKCTEIEYAQKDYLPRWFTDYIFELYESKCTLKEKDPLLYALSKAKLNSMYGLCATQSIRDDFIEDYDTGEYSVKEKTLEDMRASYEEYRNSKSEVLLFQWGVWVTSYASKALFDISDCIADGALWCYSDTDSLYATDWDEEKVQRYNDNCLKLLQKNKYDAVEYNGKRYILGTASTEATYTEFKTLGAKRYCGRSEEDGELHITVAGVPKRGVAELNDINDFHDGTVFHGDVTGKLTHSYLLEPMRMIDDYEVADSIDLNPCDYLLSIIDIEERFLNREIYVPYYSEENI